MEDNNTQYKDSSIIRKIEKLLVEYDYEKKDELMDILKVFCDMYGLKIDTRYLEAAKLALQLRLCKGNKITISGISNKSHHGYIKGEAIKNSIETEYIQECLIHLLERILYKDMGDYYKKDLNINIPKQILNNRWIDNKQINSIYSNYELKKIIDYEYKSYNESLSQNELKGFQLQVLYTELCKMNIFDRSATIKEYSFMYELCVIAKKENELPKGYSGSIGKQKYDIIKGKIKAYQKTIKSEDK